MNQFQKDLVSGGIRNATAATDKALAVLLAYECKPDPMLVEVAIDYLRETGKSLSIADNAIRDVGDG